MAGELEHRTFDITEVQSKSDEELLRHLKRIAVQVRKQKKIKHVCLLKTCKMARQMAWTEIAETFEQEIGLKYQGTEYMCCRNRKDLNCPCLDKTQEPDRAYFSNEKRRW